MCGKELLLYTQYREGGNFTQRCAMLHVFSCPVQASHLPRDSPNYYIIGYSEVGLFQSLLFVQNN